MGAIGFGNADIAKIAQSQEGRAVLEKYVCTAKAEWPTAMIDRRRAEPLYRWRVNAPRVKDTPPALWGTPGGLDRVAYACPDCCS